MKLLENLVSIILIIFYYSNFYFFDDVLVFLVPITSMIIMLSIFLITFKVYLIITNIYVYYIFMYQTIPPNIFVFFNILYIYLYIKILCLTSVTTTYIAPLLFYYSIQHLFMSHTYFHNHTM